MASAAEYDIPETGAVFTFGRCRFADNSSSHFFVRNDPVLEISCGDEHTALICESGRVFAFGKNDYGQLGFGHSRVVNKPSCLKHLKPFKSKHVACGKSHTIISTECCRVFAFGCNSDGQLGVGDLNDRMIPEMITGLTEINAILAVSAGSQHSALLSDKGDIYLWGSNSDGQCGMDEKVIFLTPHKIKFDHPISSISCGYYHTAFISDGYTYTFGEEDGGKLGRENKFPNDIPGKVDIQEKCALVACGGNHTVILTVSGKAYSFGSNFSGQLGVGNNETEFKVPQLIAFPEKNIKVIMASCGESHLAFISDKGKLYTCGDARHGKLCNENDIVNIISPTFIDAFKNYFCTFVSCGGCHTMVLANNRRLANANAETDLPPLKLKGGLEPRNVNTNKKVNKDNITVQDVMQSNKENDECDSTSNTESNLNEEFKSLEDESENGTKRKSKIENVNLNSNLPQKDSPTEKRKEDIVIVTKQKKVNTLFSLLKIKKSNFKLLGGKSNTKGGDQEAEGNITVTSRQTSKACTII